MTALKVLGGMLFFVPSFIGIGVFVAWLSEKHRTGLAFLFLLSALALLLTATTMYGHAVR